MTTHQRQTPTPSSAPTHKSSKQLALAQIILASLCFGFLGIFGRIAAQNGLNVGVLLTSRFSVAALLLGLYFVLLAPKKLLLGWNQFAIASLQGLFGYAVFSTLYFRALEGISVSLASMLLFTYPLWIMLIHAIRGESLKKSQWLTLAAALAGLLILLWGPFEVTTLRSLIYGLGAGITYAIYIYISSRVQQEVHPLASSFYVILWTAIGLAVFHHPEDTSWKVTWMSLTPNQSWIIFGMAMICTIIPLILVLSSLQKLPSPLVALVSLIEPVTATLAAWVILNENLTWYQIFGGLVVLTAAGTQIKLTQPSELVA
ncbi:MAG: DMT family transporter [Bdellovibrionales bacterium]|nr:DMT family transporter [Bdellovibrionales bacterium]